MRRDEIKGFLKGVASAMATPSELTFLFKDRKESTLYNGSGCELLMVQDLTH